MNHDSLHLLAAVLPPSVLGGSADFGEGFAGVLAVLAYLAAGTIIIAVPMAWALRRCTGDPAKPPEIPGPTEKSESLKPTENEP